MNIAKIKFSPTTLIVLSVVLAVAMFVFSNQPGHQPSEPPVGINLAPRSSPQLVAHQSLAIASSRARRAFALDAAFAETDPQKRSIAFGRLLAAWLDEDLEGALAYVRGMPPGPQYDEALFMTLDRIVQNDSKRAVLLANEMVHSDEQKQVYSSLFSQMVKHDLAGTLQLLALTPDGTPREFAYAAVASTWAAKDMDASLVWAQSIPTTEERYTALDTCLKQLAEHDPHRAFTLALQAFNGGVIEDVVGIGFHNIVQQNPQSAIPLISLLPPGDLQNSLTSELARALTAQNPDSAIAWLQSLPPGSSRQTAFNNALDVWAPQNLAAAAQYVSQMPAGDEQQAAASHLAQTFGATDPAGGMQWAQTLPNESTRDVAVVNIVNNWAMQDPAAATRWAQSLAADDPARARASSSAYSYWQMIDPAAANSFAQTLPRSAQASLLEK